MFDKDTFFVFPQFRITTLELFHDYYEFSLSLIFTFQM
jgi:hypothetical protein